MQLFCTVLRAPLLNWLFALTFSLCGLQTKAEPYHDNAGVSNTQSTPLLSIDCVNLYYLDFEGFYDEIYCIRFARNLTTENSMIF